MRDYEKYYWLICPSCYQSVKKLFLDIIAYTRCSYCGKVWFQEGEGLPAMSEWQQAHYQIEKLKTETPMNKGQNVVGALQI